MVLKTLLESRGLKVIGLDNPEQFWEKLPDFAPDLLILDVEMPDISGIELCQIIRSDRDWRRLPILCLTTEFSSRTRHQVFTAGADDCLSKPFAGSELIARILAACSELGCTNIRLIASGPSLYLGLFSASSDCIWNSFLGIMP